MLREYLEVGDLRIGAPESPDFITSKSSVSFDWLIISGRYQGDLEPLLQTLDVKTLIFDGTLPPWKRKEFQDMASKANQPYIDLRETGSIIEKLKFEKTPPIQR